MTATGRTLPGNLRRVLAWVGVPDAYSVGVANTMALDGTSSTRQRGAQGLSNQDLPGSGVNQCHALGNPQQVFAGIAGPVAAPASKFGGLTAGHLPNTGTGTTSLAWLSLSQASTMGYGS